MTIFLVSFFLAGCGKDYVTGKSTYNFYSIGSDVDIGNYVMKTQLKDLKKNGIKIDLEADADEYRRIRKIVNKITAVSHIPDFPYEVHLADVNIVNAWCAPGGKIMVYTGLYQPRKGLVQKGNDDEMAAVLAHEISHATARHVTEMITKASTFQMVGDIATSVIVQSGSAGGADVFQQIYYGGVNVYLPHYSRKNESEADAIGIMYMAAAGYDPQAAVNLWERAARESKSDKTSIFASHPASGARAAALKKLLPKATEIYLAVTKKAPAKKKKSSKIN
ncbi:MAG: M48 family metallopeptidase [Deltaproteobacteria bacterium]|nr:M48 family metallopeptidase [Deltaproteobacteria bacterium]MDZ4224496.1 M48 family metallopeptidase [bacterium]